MLSRIRGWLDERLDVEGALALLNRNLRKHLPPHVNWLFTFGAALTALLILQALTGVLLMVYYKPTAAAAHASVQSIAYDITAGWFVRGLHKWGSHLIVLLACMHMVRVFLYGGYKKPRELNWVIGVLLLAVIFGFGFTGYLLPWDQVSYWGTVVATEAPASIPVLGPLISKFLIGANEVSDATLGRFFVLHVILLPAALAALMVLHLFLIRYQGISPLSRTDEPEPGREQLAAAGGKPFFPNHALVDLAACYIVVGLLVTLALLAPPGLGEPADPLLTPPGIKPEWYLLPVYQLLKYVPEAVGVQVPPLFLLALILLPFLLDRSPERHPARRPRVLAAAGLVLVITLALGLLGHFSDTRQTIMGKTYQFDSLGMPARVAPAAEASG